MTPKEVELRRELRRQHYQKNRERIIAYNVAWRREKNLKLKALLAGHSMSTPTTTGVTDMAVTTTYDGFTIIPPSRNVDGSLLPGGVRITCTECGAEETANAKSIAHAQCAKLSMKKFRDKGWFIGKNRNHDLCPDCNAKTRKPRTITLTIHQPQPVIEDTVTTNTSTPSDNAIIVSTPREMTREDRRIVLSKLNDVYLDERLGYDKGWSDKKVAQDLGVPQAWVAQLRDENFGPDNSNEEARALVELTQRLTSDVAEFKARFDALMVDRDALVRRMSDLERMAARIEKLF